MRCRRKPDLFRFKPAVGSGIALSRTASQLPNQTAGRGTATRTYARGVSALCGPYPPCSAFPGNRGHWNHVSHRLGLHLNGQDQRVIECGNVPGTEPGTDSPECDVNYIYWEGWGTISPISGRDADKKVPVYYEAKVEDRAEPGNLKGAKNQPDDVGRYYIKVWYLNSDGTVGAAVPGFEFGSFAAPIQITGGNLRIHCTNCE